MKHFFILLHIIYGCFINSTVPIQLSDGGKIVLGSDINVNKPNFAILSYFKKKK